MLQVRDEKRTAILSRYLEVRALSVELAEPLAPEDFRIQSMPDVSPPWWNLGHTTWFFAKNILEPFGLYREQDRALEFVLNSYYESLGPRIRRDRRGLLTRPRTEEIFAFRESVDQRMTRLLEEPPAGSRERLERLVAIGIQHEQQHQELLITEIKHIMASNPAEMRQPYPARRPQRRSDPIAALRAVPFEGGLFEFGNLEGGWCWDNELAVHRAFVEDFALADRLVTQGEYLEFVEDGGYRDPLLWLANGWDQVKAGSWQAPLYWDEREGEWRIWTLGGWRELDPAEPVGHVSFYEADAFANWRGHQGGDWRGARLPTEREWEHAARRSGFPGSAANLLDERVFHPAAARPVSPGRPAQLAGDLWEWTSSHYEPYPGFEPFEGELQEYNGKFMDNQRVLRGGSCATPRSHIRVSYRNFWPGGTRFQFTGIRLARSLD